MKTLLLIIVPAVLIWLTPLCAEAKTFTAPGKFTLEYPSGWKLEDKENRFTSKEATLEHKDGSAIIFEYGADYSDLYADDNDVVDSLNTVSEQNYDSTLFESGTDKYVINNQTAPYIISTFEKSNIFGYEHQYVVMAIYIKLGNAAMIGQYLAQEDDFDKHLEQVEKIFQSVKGIGNETKTETETDDSFTSRVDDLPKTGALCDTVTTKSGKELCETLLN